MHENNQNSNSFIDKLVQELRPVQPVSLAKYLFGMAILLVTVAAYFLAAVGFRPDIWMKFSELSYLLSLAVLSGATLLSAWVCLSSAIPSRLTDLQMRKWIWGLPVFFMTATIFYAQLYGANATVLMHFSFWEALGCCLRIAKGTLLPSALLLFVVGYLAPLNPWWTMSFGVFTGAMLTSLVSQLNCPINDPLHIFIGHGLLVILFAGLLHFVFMLPFTLLLRVLARYRSPGGLQKREN